jgi:fatty-acyl-CoA synthase
MRPPYRDLTVGALSTALASALPERDALVQAQPGVRFSFAALEREARLIARGLMALGIERGERVALWATNVPEWVVLQFALAKIGAVLVTVNTSLRAHEVEYLLRQSEAATLVTIRGFRRLDYLAILSEIERPPTLQRVILIGQRHRTDATDLIEYDTLRSLASRVREHELDTRESAIGIDDVINMQYTSGTTGFPKGVMLSSRNIVNNGFWLAEGLGFGIEDRLCLCVPLFHCFGCVIGVLGAYTHGAALALIESFEPRAVLETVERERCTALYGVPTMFIAELEDPEFSRFDLRSLRTGVMAGALCPEALMKRVMSEMNLRELTIAYGLTEASPGITQTLRDDTLEHRTQTVGRVMPEMAVKIVDPATGAALGVGEPGELCVRGYNVMIGYYNNPEATAAAVDGDGWLRTGDQATLDADGYVRITGRIKDIIIRGGENISPKEVEDLVREHPAVADVSVYGLASEFFGEEVGASIRLRPGASAAADEIIAFCEARIARFKVPRHVRFVAEFPLTASGKIQKFRLREAHENSADCGGDGAEQQDSADCGADGAEQQDSADSAD